jgi:hypothetical protein
MMHDVVMNDLMMHDVMDHVVTAMVNHRLRRHFGVSRGGGRGGVVGEGDDRGKHERRAEADRRKNLDH